METLPMGHRVLSTEETLRYLDRVKAFHDGNAQKPAYIDAWQVKIDEALGRIAYALEQKMIVEGDATFRQWMNACLQMRFKKDTLYGYWMNDTPYRSWDELATGTMPTAEEIFFLTVHNTEDYFTGHSGVAAFVHYLDQQHAPGVMKDFVQACLRDCDALLAEGVILTPEIMHTLSHPEHVFGTTKAEILESKLHSFCRRTIQKQAPTYVQRVLVANVLAALNENLNAVQQLEFARAEAAEPRFAEYMTTRNPAGDAYIIAAQRWMIDMLFSVWHHGA